MRLEQERLALLAHVVHRLLAARGRPSIGIVAVDGLACCIPKALPRSAMCVSPCWVPAGVEMPHWLLVTMISTGSSLPGRVLQTRQVAKSPSAVPASPPVTMVMPSPPWRFCASAVPGAIAYCTSIGRGDRHDVPLPLGEVAGEVAAARVRVGGGVLHLAERADGILAQREQRARLAVVDVQVVVVEALALLHQQARAGR